MKNQLTHFMITAENVHKSAEFYRDVLGFVIDDETEDWVEMKMENGMELSIKKQEEGETTGSSGFGFIVNDCKKETELLREKGAVIRKDCEFRKGINRYLTQFNDPDGNVIWLTQKIK